MASNRDPRLVLGLFESQPSLIHLFRRLGKYESYRNNAFIVTDRLSANAGESVLGIHTEAIGSIEQIIEAKGLKVESYLISDFLNLNPNSQEQMLTWSPLLVDYPIDLPGEQIIVGLNSSRAGEVSRIFKKFGALETGVIRVPRQSSLAGLTQMHDVRSALVEIASRATSPGITVRPVGVAGPGNTSLSGPSSVLDEIGSGFIRIPEINREPASVGTELVVQPDRFRPLPSAADIPWLEFPLFRSAEPPFSVTVPRGGNPATPVAPTGGWDSLGGLGPPSPGSSPGVWGASGPGAPPSAGGPPSGGGQPPSEPPKNADNGSNSPPERYIESRFPRDIAPGSVCHLEVRISVHVGEGDQRARITPGVLPDDKSAEVLLLLHAPDFTIMSGSRERTVTVPAREDSPFALWEIRPEKVGVLALSITAYYAGNPLGELTLEANVVPGGETRPSVTRAASAQFQQRTPGDVTLEIRFDDKNNFYRCTFVSESMHSRDMDSRPLKMTPESAIDALIQQLNVIAKGRAKMTAEATREFLRDKGVDLWNEFIPEELQELFWQERQNIGRITILSAGDPVPWELLYPTKPREAADSKTGFLGEAFNLTRWRFGKNPPEKLRSGRTCFVLPPNAPPKAVAEVELLKSLIGNDSMTVASSAAFREAIKSNDFGVFHFACHNQFQINTGSIINMEDGPISPSTLSQYRNTLDRPLIFMNACRTDGSAPSYTKLVSWADKFLDAGSGAFIGSLWEVRDDSAAIFAKTFYEQLQGQGLGEASKAARQSICDIGGDPTWLAYSVYGRYAANVTQ